MRFKQRNFAVAKSTLSGWSAVPDKIRQAAARGILAGTESVRNEAISLINNSPPTGRVYVRNGVSHTASSPGNPPRSDTGTLINQIRTEYEDGGLTGVVISAAEYAKALEFGTENFEARPYMRPALQNKIREINETIRSEIGKAMK